MLPRRIIPATAIAIIAIIIAVLVFNRLGASDVCSANEAVEGVFVQQMVEHGAVLFPLENGSTPMYKPPLFHWTALALDRLLGIKKVTAANLRGTAAFYALACAILTMVFALRVFGLEVAILAGLTLAGSYQYIVLGRFGRVDMALCFFETLSLFAFIWWMPANRKTSVAQARGESNVSALYLMAVAMGLGVLAKGPVGAILPGTAILIFMIVEGRGRQLLAMLDPGAIILGAAVASSWYLACYLNGRYMFLDRQLGAENVGRFFGGLGAMVPWYYLKPVLLNSAPLSLLVPIAVVYALRRHAPSEIESSQDEPTVARSAVRLFAIFWIVTVVFFSLAAYKRRAYLLPVWPCSAILLGWWLTTIPPIRYRRPIAWGFAVLCIGLAIFNFVYIPRTEIAACRDDSFRPAAAEIARVVSPADPLFIYGLGGELAPLLFYLDRDAPVLDGRLGDAPPGFIIIPAGVWKQHQGEALDLEPVLTSDHGRIHLVLLKHGKAYASRE
jgi:4-amino-4-deoxy-L-arabinose transferase-like glycosyltransferase